jgi:acetyltransferase-like isoleucine patch superfamily enzyme
MNKFIRRVFCVMGNHLPPKLNKLFYKWSGVKFNAKNVWIGNKCYFDTMFPENIVIHDNVCISSGVTIVTHFDPTESIKNHPIKKYKKKVEIESETFIGPSSIIMPGVTIGQNVFIKSGSVVNSSIKKNSIVEGNPQRLVGIMNKKISSRINNLNKKFQF